MHYNATHTGEVQIIIVTTLTCTTEGFGTALQSFRPFASVLHTDFKTFVAPYTYTALWSLYIQ